MKGRVTMKRWAAFLFVTLLVMTSGMTVWAETTTAETLGDVTQTEIITQTTVIYEEVEVEVLEKVHSAFPDGTALALIVIGGVFVLLSVTLLCVFLFAFPRWGLMKAPKEEPEADAPAAEVSSEDNAAEEAEQSTSVSLQDLF